jgi:hypothetical protein
MDNGPITPAPGWRRLLAGLIDGALVVGIASASRRLRGSADGGLERSVWVVSSLVELLRQHVGSPGQRALGLRTVDERTGRGVPLWRTLAVFGLQSSTRVLSRLFAPGGAVEEERRREQFMAELKEIARRHPEDGPARERERRALFDRYPQPNMVRKFAPALAATVLSGRLQRRLPPTTEILVRRRASHSP